MASSYIYSSSSSTLEKPGDYLLEKPASSGTHKVIYNDHGDWDFDLDVNDDSLPIDVSLVLPHYRARNQPSDHRMSMFVGGSSQPIRVKVCRHAPRTKFFLEVQADKADVTIWLPSDFKGSIIHTDPLSASHHAGSRLPAKAPAPPKIKQANFSAGFTNNILRNTTFNPSPEQTSSYEDVCMDGWDDKLIVNTRGNVTFRMWDVRTGAPESPQKEVLKRIFGGCLSKKSPETAIDWDFLLED